MASKPVFDDVAPWPERKEENPRAVLGGNNPPIEERIPAEFREALLLEQEDFYQKLDDLLGKGDPNAEGYVTGSVDRAKCTSEEEFAKCGVLVNILRKAKQRVEKVHKEQKQPYLDGGRLVDLQKNSLVSRFDAAAQTVEELQREFAREQNRKRLKEEADRAEEQRLIDLKRTELEELAKEKGLEEVLPPAPEPVYVPAAAARPAPIRTDGATVSTGMEWKSRVTDHAKAFKLVKGNASVREAIEKAVQAHAKATKGNNGKPVPGVEMWEDVKVSNR